jgi:cell division protein FtsB
VNAPDLVGLQGQLDRTLAALQAVTQRIQQVSAENLELRREIAGLYQQLELPRSV